MNETVDLSVEPKPWKREDPVWVHVYGRWRRGVVVATNELRVKVRHRVREGSGDSADVREKWFAHLDGHPVLPGGLDPPVATSCPYCTRRLPGWPGQPEEAVIGRHLEQTPECAAAAAADGGGAS